MLVMRTHTGRVPPVENTHGSDGMLNQLITISVLAFILHYTPRTDLKENLSKHMC